MPTQCIQCSSTALVRRIDSNNMHYNYKPDSCALHMLQSPCNHTAMA